MYCRKKIEIKYLKMDDWKHTSNGLLSFPSNIQAGSADRHRLYAVPL